MKVEELIKQLKKCNPDADVEVIDIEGNYSCDLLQVEDNEDRVYFYYYDGLVYVSEQKLFAKNYSYKLNSLEVRAFKKVYLKIRRRIYHNCMKYYLSHHVAEAILRTQLSGIDLLDYFKKIS